MQQQAAITYHNGLEQIKNKDWHTKIMGFNLSYTTNKLDTNIREQDLDATITTTQRGNKVLKQKIVGHKMGYRTIEN
jgi:hypothetical protein